MRRLLILLLAVVALGACTSGSETPSAAPGTTTAGSRASGATVPSADPAKAEEIRTIVRKLKDEYHLQGVIVKVTIDGKEIVTDAVGDSMTDVPVTADMHFRNGAVAISYVANLLLQLVDQKVVSLDDKVAKYLPDVPHAEEVTLGQLATMTSGYQDYVFNSPEFQQLLLQDPFRTWTPQELLAFAVPKPLFYAPGTNWNYAHTNYVVLGLALEKATGKPMTELMREKVLGPFGLDQTTDPQSPAIPEPVLHAFTSERKEVLGIPDATAFTEESTFWNPSWTITHGAIQVTTIDDLVRGAVAIGTGQGLTPESYQLMVSTRQRDFGGPVEGCGSCRRGDASYTYGMGIVIKGDWLLQNPMFAGESAVAAYLPSQKIAIGVANTYAPAAFAADGTPPSNRSMDLFSAIATALAPDEAPPK
ncbi:MAG: serine hydrolase domain-containing protein [Acidimicrobiales bacterium]